MSEELITRVFRAIRLSRRRREVTVLAWDEAVAMLSAETPSNAGE